MSTSARVPSWDVFAEEVADLAGVTPDQVQSESRIVEDLDLDSLALAELVVLLVDTYRLTALATEWEQRSWEATTVEQLFEEVSRRA